MKPKRKGNRLTDYDYSRNGAYFITICTQGLQQILWESDTFTEDDNVGASIARPQRAPTLSKTGKVVEHLVNSCSLPAYFSREICRYAKSYPFIIADTTGTGRATNGRPYSLNCYAAV